MLKAVWQRFTALLPGIPASREALRREFYISVGFKYYLCLFIAAAWSVFCVHLARLWIEDLARFVPFAVAFFAVAAVAIVPGFMYMFTAASLVFDRRPKPLPGRYPPLSVIIPAYNEEKVIRSTIESIRGNEYPGRVDIIVADDGSTDATAGIASAYGATVIRREHRGKSAALNDGLAAAPHELIVSVDSDTFLRKNALKNLVERLNADPARTAAVAGAVLVRNSRDNLMTRMQEWDYFHGIGSIKRMQSLFHGTLVVQGAFSLYRKSVVMAAGGWKNTVGEDIVLTWTLLARGYRTGFAENAVAFTRVPDTYRQFFRQRKRWARGMIEGFKHTPEVLVRLRFSTLFIVWDVLYPLLDAAYLFIFVPGLILALFGYYFIAGPMTLLVLPLAFLVNLLMYAVQKDMFHSQGLVVRKNRRGFVLYILVYQFLLSPASVAGYVSEIFGFSKRWGTR